MAVFARADRRPTLSTSPNGRSRRRARAALPRVPPGLPLFDHTETGLIAAARQGAAAPAGQLMQEPAAQHKRAREMALHNSHSQIPESCVPVSEATRPGRSAGDRDPAFLGRAAVHAGPEDRAGEARRQPAVRARTAASALGQNGRDGREVRPPSPRTRLPDLRRPPGTQTRRFQQGSDRSFAVANHTGSLGKRWAARAKVVKVELPVCLRRAIREPLAPPGIATRA